MTPKEIKEFADLYGWSVLVPKLKTTYKLASWCKNSAPTPGSLTLSTSLLNANDDTKIIRVVLHKNKELTIVTNQGWLRFLN